MSIPLDWTGTHLVRTTLLTLMLAAGVSACLDPLASGLPPDDGTPYCPVTSGLSSEGVTGYRATTRVTGYWIFHFDAPAVNDHVQLVRAARDVRRGLHDVPEVAQRRHQVGRLARPGTGQRQRAYQPTLVALLKWLTTDRVTTPSTVRSCSTRTATVRSAVRAGGAHIVA